MIGSRSSKGRRSDGEIDADGLQKSQAGYFKLGATGVYFKLGQVGTEQVT